MPELPGREALLARLEAELRAGRSVLLVGPPGMGKSTVLEALFGRLAARGLPCGLAPVTASLGQVTAALARVYAPAGPLAGGRAVSARRLRSELRLAAEERPGALLLDHVRAPGTAVRGFLRVLRGMRLGVLLAADAGRPQERVGLRALGLAQLELELPPLASRQMRALWRALEAERAGLVGLGREDRARLMRLVRGNPGRLVACAELLRDARFWHQGRVAFGLLGAACAEQGLYRHLAGEAG